MDNTGDNSGSRRRSLRLVVQRVKASRYSVYRIVAYGEGCSFRSPDFDSIEIVRQVLATAIPHLDFGLPDRESDSSHSSVIFSEDVVLDDRQASVLQLR